MRGASILVVLFVESLLYLLNSAWQVLGWRLACSL
ncbi:hypothetical protein P308_29640 [Pseudomonas piscis]|nr:hypothetical protein P308_29640 [Pseudomonas piscis]